MTFQRFHRIRQWCGEEKGEERVSGKGQVYSPPACGGASGATCRGSMGADGEIRDGMLMRQPMASRRAVRDTGQRSTFSGYLCESGMFVLVGKTLIGKRALKRRSLKTLIPMRSGKTLYAGAQTRGLHLSLSERTMTLSASPPSRPTIVKTGSGRCLQGEVDDGALIHSLMGFSLPLHPRAGGPRTQAPRCISAAQ